MTYYTSGDELFDNENTVKLALFVDSVSITFDDVMKSSKSRKAMDLEIEVIAKNILRNLLSYHHDRRV